ncbi:MAG: sigma-70 family RNA polymerase sigma factor [Proteobacteria bacterium]|nr:sigma-70 family RNA polymerase sigma factor [Pseudomonadota bacterium]
MVVDIDGVEVLPAEGVALEASTEPATIFSEDDEPVETEERAADRSAARTRDIIPYDPLSAYLREAGRHPPLSKEEEHQLALRYFTSKDREAGYKLVVSNLWLVIKIAREYEKAARNLLDLIQEGNIGLIEAVKNFDPYRGVRFPSYAVWWVRAYIIRHIIANWRMVKIGTTQAQRKLFFNLRKEKEKLEREGFSPAPKLLAEKLNVKEDEVIEMEQRLGSSELSVDAPLLDESEQNMHGLLPSGELSAEERLGDEQLRGLILKSFDQFAATLSEKERLIFKERMLGEEKATLQDISEKLNISRERVRQIETRLRERLREFLVERLGADALGELKF